MDFDKPPAEAEKLTVYQNHGQVFIRWNNLPLTVYRTQPGLKYPYFSPLIGPASGLSVTSESGYTYPHHRGLFLGCEPLNGGDYWRDGPLEEGQIMTTGLETELLDETSVVITTTCTWVRPEGHNPFTDERQFTIRVANDDLWSIDCELTLHAQEDIEIESAKHSFLAIRTESDLSPLYGGILENSEGGRFAEGTQGVEAKWCGYYGKREMRPDVTEGICVMAHPANAFRPVYFTRDYGHLSPSPFNFLEEPWTMAKGESLRLRYLVVVHAGDPREAGLDAVYDQWARESRGMEATG